MKKLSLIVICLGVFGYAGTALAGGPDHSVDCPAGGGKASDTVCLETLGWLVEIEVNCLNPTGDPGDFSGGLEADDNGDWGLDVVYDSDTVCMMGGTLDIANPLFKTDVKCTDALKGPNKNGHPHGTGDLQVDAEVKAVDGCGA